MKRNLIRGVAVLSVISACLVFSKLIINKTDSNNSLSLEEQRSMHQYHLDNSPFKETLTWDKSKRKNEGLPPDRYFEQMWELTLNPATGKLEDGELTLLREQLIANRS